MDANNGPAVVTVINIETDIIPEDFFSCVCALMGIACVGARLGWKSKGDGAKRDLYTQLNTNDHLAMAFAHLVELKKNTCRRKPVAMEIMDMVSVLLSN